MFGCIIDYAQWWLNMSYLRVIVILLSGLIIIVGGLKKSVGWVDKSQICFIVIYNFQAPNLYPLLYGGSVSTRHSRLIRQPLTMQALLIDSLTLPSQTIDTEHGLSTRGRTTHEDGNAGCDVCSTDNHRCIWTLQTWVPFNALLVPRNKIQSFVILKTIESDLAGSPVSENGWNWWAIRENNGCNLNSQELATNHTMRMFVCWTDFRCEQWTSHRILEMCWWMPDII